MIKINLLPVKEKKKRQQILVGIYIGLGLLSIAFLLGWLLSTQYQKRAALKVEIAKIEEESTQYKDKIEEIRALEESQKRLESYRKIADSVSSEQKKLIGSLDQLASQLPAEVWIQEIVQGDEKTPNELIVRGYSLSETMLKVLIQNISRAGGFLSQPSNLEIKNFSVQQNGNTVYQFEFKTQMVAPK